MFSNILQVIISMVIIGSSIEIFIKGYKEAKDVFEKTLYISLSVVAIVPLIIYYLDRYNLPTRFGYTQNVNSDNWLNVLTNYSASIISTLISSVFLIIITFKQTRQTYKDNIKLNNETYKANIKLNNEMQRIQNLPFLRYDFTSESLSDEAISEKRFWIFSKSKNQNLDSISFTIQIENIGLNSVRKLYLELQSELFKSKQILPLYNQSNIEKGEVKKKEFIITNVKEGNYKIELIVYYQDLLKNWYEQKIHLNVTATNIYNLNINGRNCVTSFTVEDETLLNKEPLIIKHKTKKN